MDNGFNPFSLEGKNILITGASSGIGRQCAIDCSKMGANVVLTGRNRERLEETAGKLHFGNHKVLSIDLNDTDNLKKSILEIVTESGPFSGYVHSAGIEKTQLLKNLKPKDYLEVFSTNFIGGVEVLKYLTKKGNYNQGFKAVFISSITAHIARVGTLAYTASKGAIVSAVRELAAELAPRGININCISPGTILTPMMENYLSTLTEEDYKKRVSGFPLGLGQTTDVSNAAIYLLSDASRWITGQNITIDGGYTII